MNSDAPTDPRDTQVLVRPEVAAFVDEVRRLLADLDDETRDELVGGLEADLSDQLADGAQLGDPVAYASELRAAAGLPERRRRVGLSGLAPRHVDELLDRARGAFLDRATAPRARPGWDLLVALRPVWWVARAWILLTALDVATGYHEQVTLVPSLGFPFLGDGLLLAAIVLSTLVGTGRLWPGTGERGTAGRLALLAVNGFALLAPLSFDLPNPTYLGPGGDAWSGYNAGYHDAQREHAREDGLRIGDRVIHNVFAYDSQGRPIDLVQLVDEDGEPIAVGADGSVQGRGEDRTVGCPAFNGRTPVYHAYPLAEVLLRRGTCQGEEAAGDARPPQHPLASVPPVTAGPQDTQRSERTVPERTPRDTPTRSAGR